MLRILEDADSRFVGILKGTRSFHSEISTKLLFPLAQSRTVTESPSMV